MNANVFQLDSAKFTDELARRKSSDAVRLQLTEGMSDSEFQKLGDLFSRFRDLTISLKDLTHRAWDLQFLDYFPQTRSFQLKCVWSLRSWDAIARLRELHELELGSVLNGVVTLSPITTLPKLRSCAVTGKWSELSSLGCLKSLEKLVLSGFTAGDLHFVSELPQLRELELIDSSFHNFSELQSDGVTSLRLVNLKKLIDLEWLSKFPQLQHLKLKNLPRVIHLPPQCFLDQLQSFSATHLRGAGIRSTVELRKEIHPSLF